MRLPHVEGTDGIDFVVLGLPFDTATSFRSGARFGPEAIRAMSHLLRPYNPELEVDIFEHLSGVDGGDLPVAPGDTVATYELAAEGLRPYVAAGVFTVVLGGDHAITLAELRALHEIHGPLALVHLDAHGDTWHEYFGQRYFHGTTFRRAAEEGVIDPSCSVQAGMRGSLYGAADIEDARGMGFTVLSTRELRELGPDAFGALVRSRTAGRPVFLSFDVDFCDPSVAPGTGTPEIGGPSSAEAARFVRALAGVDLVGADVVEVAPPYDSAGQITALLGANIAWEAISLRALARSPARAEAGT
ncbi:MAG: agmatinase [Gaiellales bacterium]